MSIFGNEDAIEIEQPTARVVKNSLGIDLGTLNTVIAKPSGDKFDLYQIPSVVAVKKDDPSAVLAVGEEAKKMLGRTPEDIVAVRPLKKGVIENIAQAQALLIRAMEIGINEGEIVGRIVIGIPGDASEVEKNAAEEIGRKAGAETVLVVSEGLAAAIGAGLPIAEPNGTMVIDIGAGSTDLVVISLGGINDQYICIPTDTAQHHDNGGNTCAKEYVGWQSDNGIDIVILHEVRTDGFLLIAPE